MNDQEQQIARPPVTIRSYTDRDQTVVSDLYQHGLLEGLIAPNDTGADIDNIVEAYFDEPRHHFWVAEIEGAVVGMIGVGSDEEHTAEIRRLRVDPRHQNEPVAQALLDEALNHCKSSGYLKIRFDTRLEKTLTTDLFERLGFHLNRERPAPGKALLEFYLDLYRPHNPDAEPNGSH
jgi:ribosomal protein S18 acetylase RimI-like enzyme